MVQGGDPTATGKGGQSAFEKPFNDEICKLYSHEGRGVLSMANKGPNTNQSQFFITFRSCKYLDGKHTIFGRLVGGLDVLSKIESIETDEKDKPKEDVIILKTVVFVDPYKEAEKMIEEERAKDDERHTSNAIRALKTEETKTQPIRKGVGSLISLDAIHKRNAVNASNDDNYEDNKSNFKSKKIKTTGGFGDFKNW
ncbi:hypothetical protein SSS_04203 [Sarcoptes scabiei]|nr:hypothetical protein SSS_04203 [Sarcoptes scabiei]